MTTARILLGSALKLKLRYVFLRGGTYYYQRKVPKDLTARYGTPLLKINLKTSDPYRAARAVEALNQRVESEWAALRNDAQLTPAQARAGGHAILRQHGLQPYPKDNPETALEYFLDTLERKRREYAEYAGPERRRYPREVAAERYDHPVENYLKPSEVAAVQLLKEEPPLLLSDAVSVYLEDHPKANDARFSTYTLRVWNTLIDALGDKPIMEVGRADANTYRDRRLAKGNKSTTVRRQIGVIRAVFAVVIREKELGKVNPFESVRIANLGEDAKSR